MSHKVTQNGVKIVEITQITNIHLQCITRVFNNTTNIYCKHK